MTHVVWHARECHVALSSVNEEESVYVCVWVCELFVLYSSKGSSLRMTFTWEMSTPANSARTGGRVGLAESGRGTGIVTPAALHTESSTWLLILLSSIRILIWRIPPNPLQHCVFMCVFCLVLSTQEACVTSLYSPEETHFANEGCSFFYRRHWEHPVIFYYSQIETLMK